MKNRDVYNAQPALAELSKTKLPASASMKIVRFIRHSTTTLEDIEKMRMSLLEQYAKRNNAGDMLYIDDAKTQVDVKQPDFDHAWIEVLDMESDMPISKPLFASDFGGAEIAANTLLALSDLLYDNEPPDPQPA